VTSQIDLTEYQKKERCEVYRKRPSVKKSSRPEAILILPSTMCSSCVTNRNSNFQQLAKDKKLNSNQWEVHLNELKFGEDTWPDPQLQKAKAQHSVLIANLNRQGYREVKLHVILVGVMETTYKDYRQTSGRP